MRPLRYLTDIFLCILYYILQELDRFWDTFGNFVKMLLAITAVILLFLSTIYFLNKIPATVSPEDRQHAEYVKLLEEQNALLQKLLLEIQK